jgi:hypothetical protein
MYIESEGKYELSELFLRPITVRKLLLAQNRSVNGTKSEIKEITFISLSLISLML